jgi:hypothetical protein
VINRLSEAFRFALSQPEVSAKLKDLGLDAGNATPFGFAAILAA